MAGGPANHVRCLRSEGMAVSCWNWRFGRFVKEFLQILTAKSINKYILGKCVVVVE